MLGQILDSLPVDSRLHRRCLRALRKTCGIYGILPDSYTFTSPLSKPGERPFAPGGFSDVWKLTDETNSRDYGVKRLRVYQLDPTDKINKVRSSLRIRL